MNLCKINIRCLCLGGVDEKKSLITNSCNLNLYQDV